MISQLTCIIGFGNHIQFWTVIKILNSDEVCKTNIVVHVLYIWFSSSRVGNANGRRTQSNDTSSHGLRSCWVGKKSNFMNCIVPNVNLKLFFFIFTTIFNYILIWVLATPPSTITLNWLKVTLNTNNGYCSCILILHPFFQFLTDISYRFDNFPYLLIRLLKTI